MEDFIKLPSNMGGSFFVNRNNVSYIAPTESEKKGILFLNDGSRITVYLSPLEIAQALDKGRV